MAGSLPTPFEKDWLWALNGKLRNTIQALQAIEARIDFMGWRRGKE